MPIGGIKGKGYKTAAGSIQPIIQSQNQATNYLRMALGRTHTSMHTNIHSRNESDFK